jgi:alpha-amylase
MIKMLYKKNSLLAKIVFTGVFSLVMLSGACAQSPGTTYWWNDAVFYEVFVRSFNDNNGDGKGDLKGLIEKLDYLNDGDPTTNSDLGVTALWLMPIQQSPSYHGYDITDYRTVEQDYGTNQDFKNLIDSAHARGIKVIIDFVMNHTSSEHPWFVASTDSTTTKRDWYIWKKPAPSMLGPWGEQVWYPTNGSNYYAVFWSGMPDLNYTTQAVKDTMFSNAQFWLQSMGADGFRLDAAPYIIENGDSLMNTSATIKFWEDFRAYYKSLNPNAYAIGEAWETTSLAQEYVNNNGIDNCFEFDLASAIINTVNTGNTSGLTSKINQVITSYPFLQYGTFLADHDVNRVMDQLGDNVSKAKLAFNFVMTFPGVPYIYYGEEIGMTGSGADQNKRTPMQWTNGSQAGFTTGTPWETVNSNYASVNVQSEQYDSNSLWNHYRNLIAIRKNQAALRRGTYQALTTSTSSVFSFLRQYNTENIIVISNTSSSALSNVQISLSNGGIAQGTYKMIELQGGDSLSVTVDNTGSFSNLTISQIPAQSTLLYKLLASGSTKTSVMFQVNMNAMIAAGNFKPATDYVDIVADFNNFGADSITKLKDPNGDGIYSVTIPGMSIGNNIHYKYRIDAVNNGKQEFANSSYVRQYLVLEGVDTVTVTYQQSDPTVTAARTPTSHSINIYPVPTSKEIVVKYSIDFINTIQYKITDLLGVEKLSSSFVSNSNNGQYDISCETLSSGVYLLTVEYNGTSEIFRIVIQK